ncbi:MAG TPA: hypothetical protein PK323_05380 [Bacteroidia bacterium]|nr:hypothetical protein [Bacteroidia bacterium]
MKNIINIVLSLIFASYLLVSININFGKNKWQDVLESDAWGYYAYLPAVFVYQDLHFTFYEKIMHGGYFEERLAYEYRVGNDGKVANKYFCGTAVAISPFYIIAHIISPFFGYSNDGYNRIYILSVNIAAVFYTVLGLFFLSKLLSQYTKNVLHVILVIITVAFGTQLFYYSFGEPGMSHVYSFCFVNLFLWKMKSWFADIEQDKRGANLFCAAFALGMIFLIRPFNILILLALPFIAGSFNILKNKIMELFKQKYVLMISVSIFVITAGIQLLIYFIQTGNLWVDSYPGENFNFLNPHFTEVLFSFKKGLFIYTPLFLVAQAGVYFLFKSNKFMFVAYLLFFTVLTYVLSCWWIWYYGGSFSMRPYIEYFGLFTILLIVLLENFKQKRLLILVMLLIVVLCQIQTYQYRYFVIHWSEMDKAKYLESLQHIFS